MKRLHRQHRDHRHLDPRPPFDDPREQALSDALDVWAAWLRAGTWVEGYPDHTVTFGDVRNLTDWEQLEQEDDVRIAEGVDAAVRDLPEVERSAVFAVKTRCVYPHGISLEIAYGNARALLLETLYRRRVLIS
jgi:hypothetical protein